MEGYELEQIYSEMQARKMQSGWDRKLTAASYLHHRDTYRGTKVESRTTYDSSPSRYMLTFVNGVLGNLVPREQKWFVFSPMGLMKNSSGKVELYTRYKHIDSDPKMYERMANLTDLVAIALQQSNFYKVMSMFLKDAIVFGNGYMLCIDEWGHKGRLNRAGSTFKLRFQVVDPQEIVVREDAHNQVDMYVRKFYMTEAAIEDRWDVSVDRTGSGRYKDEDWDVYEAVYPVSEGKWEYFAYLPSGQKTLEKKVLDRFPLFVYAMDRDNDKTPYGDGIAPKYLDDIVTLDEYGKAAFKMGQRAGSPPLMVPPGMFDDFSAKPGTKLRMVDEQNRAVRVFEGEDPNMMLTMLQDARETLRSAFYADLFTAIMQSNDSRRTAYEISETVKQANNLLKEHIYTLLDSFFSPILCSVADIVIRQSSYMSEGDDKIELFRSSVLSSVGILYNSVFMKMIDEVMKTEGILTTFNLVGAVAQIYPGGIANFDVNGMLRQAAIGSGLDTSLLRDSGSVQREQSEANQRASRQADSEIAKTESESAMNNAKVQALQSGGLSGSQVQV